MATAYQLKNLPAIGAAAITPSDSVDLTYITRGLIVGTAGDVKVTMKNGDVVVLPALVAGITHPFCVRRVWSTSTTAATIVGAY